jgi:hypothetical protein
MPSAYSTTINSESLARLLEELIPADALPGDEDLYGPADDLPEAALEVATRFSPEDATFIKEVIATYDSVLDAPPEVVTRTCEILLKSFRTLREESLEALREDRAEFSLMPLEQHPHPDAPAPAPGMGSEIFHRSIRRRAGALLLRLHDNTHVCFRCSEPIDSAHHDACACCDKCIKHIDCCFCDDLAL